ncbi:4'-phosphopantetheinyl transferase superfamily protein, partial [Streptomyces sp. NPDC059466]|uniref:4'-phosphopantetheinyl transferase superfamily protein n=1 Tax=Streptomyces sp. NPDC059466 TaxID=3346843 RepID=UPI0036BC5C2D
GGPAAGGVFAPAPPPAAPADVFVWGARPPDHDRLRRLAERDPSVHWDRLLFSAKESVYKAWFPLMRRWLDFLEADIDLFEDGGPAAHGVRAGAFAPGGPTRGSVAGGTGVTGGPVSGRPVSGAQVARGSVARGSVARGSVTGDSASGDSVARGSLARPGTCGPARSGGFRATLLVPGPVVGGRRIQSFDGRWTVRQGLLATAVTVPHGGTGAI